MPAKTSASSSAHNLMYRLVLQAETDFNNDRRSEPRYPFFRSVSVRVNGQSFSAFTREISASAIGLLHYMKLPEEEVNLLVAGQRQELRGRIERSESCGEGWYISGCKVVDAGA